MYAIIYWKNGVNKFTYAELVAGGELRTFASLQEADDFAEFIEKNYEYDCRVISLKGVNE